ncbi:Transcription factor, MADS-box [Corchorus capsularis]|uniref:Transcription factor, MADS-box n=1 Tax=Corchorus capsularis TaxID=210143 RepID=A0A1R3HYK0_COCAP|nr:Transcription factor, MADS-box [Corchorus capsularis]
MVKKQSKGRQKVEMVKMTKDSNLQVTFSKRRAGLFKKASELCTLCGAEIAMVVFSPGRKVFSFGHPEVEAIIERYLSRNPPQTSGALQLVEAHRNANVRELNMQLTEVASQLEVERKRGEELHVMKNAGQSQWWWQSPVEELSLPQLLQLKSAMEELKKNVAKQVDKVIFQSMNSQQQFFMGSPSVGMQAQQLPFETKNNIAFDHGNMIPHQEYTPVAPPPHMMPPPPGFNPNPEGYNPNAHGFINPGFGRGFF